MTGIPFPSPSAPFPSMLPDQIPSASISAYLRSSSPALSAPSAFSAVKLLCFTPKNFQKKLLKLAAHSGRVILYACTKTFFDNSTQLLAADAVRLSRLPCAPAPLRIRSASLKYSSREICAPVRQTGKRTTQRVVRPSAPRPRGYCRAADRGDHAKSGNNAIVSWDPYDARNTSNDRHRQLPALGGLGVLGALGHASNHRPSFAATRRPALLTPGP
jgi:hypothetical protein